MPTPTWTRGSDAFGAALTLAVAVAAFAFGGYYLNRSLSTSPLFLLVGLALGALGGFLHVLRVLAPDLLPFGKAAARTANGEAANGEPANGEPANGKAANHEPAISELANGKAREGKRDASRDRAEGSKEPAQLGPNAGSDPNHSDSKSTSDSNSTDAPRSDRSPRHDG